jgi:hypothetical protein
LNFYPYFPPVFPNFSAQDGFKQFYQPYPGGQQGYLPVAPYGGSVFTSDEFRSYPYPGSQQGYPSAPPFGTPGFPSDDFGSSPFPGGQQGYPSGPPFGTPGSSSDEFGGSPFPGGQQGYPSGPPFGTPGSSSDEFGGSPYPGGQQGYPSGPPFGTPGSSSDEFGGSPNPDGQQTGGAPTSPPPPFTPQQSVSLQAVDPGAIRGCLYRYTYIWLDNGRSFWFYPTYVGRTSVSGFRWRGNRWVYYGTNLQRIRSFQCF